MTIHINYKGYKCPNCSVLFIPFQEKLKCPKCGKVASEFFDLIPEIITSMKYHKRRYGFYTPPAWYTGSISEYIQSIIFTLFDKIERDKPKKLNKEIVIAPLNKTNWENQDYMRKHIKGIAFGVYDIYKNDNEFKGENFRMAKDI